jgi:two-component system, sensor histidine kinase and response regulator
VGTVRSPTIGSQLTRVVLAAALPVWLASALLLYQVQVESRALIERDAAATARALMVAVDRDLASAETAALVLSYSPDLASGDLVAFHARASKLMGSGIGNNVVLTDALGQQVLNTVKPFGEPLPRHGNPELARRVFETGKPVISDLYRGGVLHRPVLSVDVPVIRDGQVIYDLSIGIFPERLSEILRQEKLPEGWIAAVFDSKGVIAARTHAADAADRFIGHKGPPALLERMAQAPEGMVETRTLEGISVSAAFVRSGVSSWAVAIGIPTMGLTVRLWKSLGLSLASTLVLIALGIAAARFTGERLARPIRALVEPALAHGRGERVAIPALGLKEADDVGRALIEGSQLLAQRTAERDEVEREKRLVLDAKRQIEKDARDRSAYFTYLSHELRTPLTAILGYSNLIANRVHATSPDPKYLSYCARIDEGIERLMGTVNEILDYARYEAHEIVLHKECLDVASEIRGAIGMLEGRAAHAGVKLQHELAADLPRLYADPNRLQQILLNLLSNALKFTPAGGTATVCAMRANEPKLVIRVEDTGIGIPAADLARILQPFARVEDTAARQREGTGLGLPLTKGLVELHGGSFEIASRLGVGTTVTVCLPVASSEACISSETASGSQRERCTS